MAPNTGSFHGTLFSGSGSVPGTKNSVYRCDAGVVASVPDALEQRDPVLTARDRLAI